MSIKPPIPSVGVPPGVIFAYGNATAPAGYLNCNGSAVSRSTYSQLFAAIGTSYGVGDGSTTFNVPKLTNADPSIAGLPIGYSGALPIGQTSPNTILQVSKLITLDAGTSFTVTGTGTYAFSSSSMLNVNLSTPIFGYNLPGQGVNYIIKT